VQTDTAPEHCAEANSGYPPGQPVIAWTGILFVSIAGSIAENSVFNCEINY